MPKTTISRKLSLPVLLQAADLFLDSQMCFALYAASLAMTKVYRQLLVSLGFECPQCVVKLALWQHGQLAAGALSDCVALESGTFVAAGSQAEKSGPGGM